MPQPLRQIWATSLKVAFQELRVNKLRTILSLLGVSIGIFCIVAVFTVLDSMEKNIKSNMASLGDDVVYVSKWPWMDEGGVYKWWEYWRRPVMTLQELRAVRQKSQTARYETLCLMGQVTAKRYQFEVGGIRTYAVTAYFEKMQNFEIAAGRYFNPAELAGGQKKVVLGHEVYEELFPEKRGFTGETVFFLGQKFQVIGVLNEAGDNMTGFDFDRGLIFPYLAAAGLTDVTALDANSMMMVQARPGIPVGELTAELEGILRAARQVAPGEKNNFSLNRLSQVTERLAVVFAMIDLVGAVIAFFSLLVGGFGIANIMFVSVKERTRIIGLKKAIGAPRRAILIEFLIEAVLLCVLGGLAGIFVVLILSVVLTRFLDFPVTLSLANFLIGVSIATVVGLLSGYIPARSAARLDPVTAIRAT